MDRHTDILNIFNKIVSKKSYAELCREENSGTSMISSTETNFCFDEVCRDIKTSDTIYIFNDHIAFIEFKDVTAEKFKKREFIRQLRLKVIESYVSLYNFLNDNGYSISKDEVSDLNLKYYFVFNKNKFINKPLLLTSFRENQKKWTANYKRFYSNIFFIDSETFIRKYGLD